MIKCFFYLSILLLSYITTSNAQNSNVQLKQWTAAHEKKLIEKYKTINSSWFQEICLELSDNLQFKNISKCTLLESSLINAYVFNNGHVYFTSSLLKLVKNKDQWASIIAHENAHLELKHYQKTLDKINHPDFFFPKKKFKKLLKNNEKEADEWAKLQLNKNHYKSSQIYYFLKRVSSLKKQESNTKSHLKLSKRATKPESLEIIDRKIVKNINHILGFNAENTPQWKMTQLPDKPSLRASTINNNIYWVAGTKGKIFKSQNKGKTWLDVSLDLTNEDIRDIHAFNKNEVIVMSVGEGDKSKLYETRDGGQNWQILFRNPYPNGFFDSIAFWDNNSGLLLGDPVDGYYYVAFTNDRGKHWQRTLKENLPTLMDKEAAFAASGNTLIVGKHGQAWYTTGGFSASVMESNDYGNTWVRHKIALHAETQTSGGYGIGLNSQGKVFVTGGDYLERDGHYSNLVTKNKSKWINVDTKNMGLRSAFSCVKNTCIITGKLGSDISLDSGKTWKTQSLQGFYTLSSDKDSILAAGQNGEVGLLFLEIN